MMVEKIIIIGLDGCELDYLLKWIQKGHLPFFRKIKETSVFGRLKSSIPPTTFPAWPCMFSGRNPGKLGAFDFFNMEKQNGGYSLKLINSRRWLGNFIWDIAGAYKKKSGIINIPFFSPTKVNGYMIDLHTGMEYPTGIFENIASKVESFKQYDQKIKARRSNELKRLKENTIIEFEVGNFLRNDYSEVDLSIQVYNILDGTAHSTQSEKILKDRYIYVDREIEKHYIDNDANTLIVSDHGMKKVKYRYYMNKWLLDNKYLKFKVAEKSEINYLSKVIMYKITNAFPSLEFYINDIAGILGKKVSYLKNIRNKELEEGENHYQTSLVDWEKTNTYAHAANASNYIGLWFTKNDENIKSELIRRIKNIKIGNENNVVKNIFKREDIYYGPELNKLPHLILELRDDIMAHTSFAPILSRSTKTYSHNLWGTIISWGPDIKEGEKITDSQIIDVAPTILHMMNIPIPNDFDGRVLHKLFKK